MKLNGSLVSSSENGWRTLRCRFSASYSHTHMSCHMSAPTYINCHMSAQRHVSTDDPNVVRILENNSLETHESKNHMMYLDSDCDEMNTMRILLRLPWQCKQRPFRMHGMTDRLIVD